MMDKMKKGDREAILKGLFHMGAIFRMNGAAFAVIHRIDDGEVAARLRELTKDPVTLDGYSVSDFAFAAMDLLGLSQYRGEKEAVKRLIESNFDFLR